MIYRPRMLARLFVPLDANVAGSDVVTFEMRPRSATLESNDHNHADTLEIEADWGDVGIDPRFARSAAVDFYMGDAGEYGDAFAPSAKTFRFAGVADKIERIAKDGHTVKITCRDFTSLFLECKLPAKGVPSFTDTLVGAWQKICDHTGLQAPDRSVVSTVKILRDRLEFRGGVDPGTVLNTAVSSRFARLSAIPIKEKADAWAVWQQCVGMLGLISFIDRDACVVTTSADQFAEDPGATPAFVWGRNILEMTESAVGRHDTKGVLLTSFDPLTGKTIEAAFNPNEKKQKKRRVSAKRQAAAANEIVAADYEAFDYYGITDPDVLQRMAERVWQERATQELEGQLTTHEMWIGTDAARIGDTGAKTSTDLLALRSGESIRVEIDPLDEGVFSILSSEARANYLIDRGYQPRAAWVLARNAGRLMQLGRTFKVRSSRVRLSADGDAGEFSVQITYCNRIELKQISQRSES